MSVMAVGILSCSSFFLVLFLVPAVIAAPLSFSLPTIGPFDTNTKVNTTGSAYISNQGIQVTPDERSVSLEQKVGRATYIKPLHLWDKVSRNLTSFSSNFSFVIDSSGSATYADGIAFFLSPVGSDLLPGSAGGGLGYGTADSLSNKSTESFVAVEFDTFANAGWDPPYVHVGISINSIRSVVTSRWPNNITNGVENNAWISYNSNSMVLKVGFTSFPGNGTKRIDTLRHAVDLRQYLPEHVIFGFSAATGALFQRNNVKSWNFSSTLDLDVVSSPEPTPSPGPNPGTLINDGKGSKTLLIVGLSVGLSVIFLASAFASYCLWKKHKKVPEDGESIDMDNEFEKGTGPKKFSYNELSNATSNFAEEEKLGEGGFGGVYRGWLRETNSYVAVKRVSRGSKQGLKEYASEVKIISQLRHRNVVQLIGWCHEKGELLLVYEFMPNGSLDFHLFKGTSTLTWEVRYKISLGLASALLYLHEEWERGVVHRDIKASNIMLDSSFNAKLGDFGLARLIDHERGSQTTILAGTMGYMAPECVITGRVSKESDIYSFGIVLLEIACGRKTLDHRLPEAQMRLVEWVWSLYGLDKLLDVVDPKLGTEFDAQEMEHLMVAGLWCVHPDSNHRPSIRQAIQVLNFEADLPVLPSVMPVPTYYTHTMRANSSSNVHYSGYSSNATTSTSGSASTLLSMEKTQWTKMG